MTWIQSHIINVRAAQPRTRNCLPIAAQHLQPMTNFESYAIFSEVPKHDRWTVCHGIALNARTAYLPCSQDAPRSTAEKAQSISRLVPESKPVCGMGACLPSWPIRVVLHNIVRITSYTHSAVAQHSKPRGRLHHYVVRPAAALACPFRLSTHH